MKAWNTFFRNHAATLCEALNEANLSAASELLQGISFTTFAEWRWRKTKVVGRSVKRGLDIFRSGPARIVLESVLRRNMQDMELNKTLWGTLTDKKFQIQFKFVLWFSDWLCDLESWGSSCPCHQQEWENGVEVPCNFRGKLLPIVFFFILRRHDLQPCFKRQMRGIVLCGATIKDSLLKSSEWLAQLS